MVTPRTIRVLFVIDSAAIGGAEHVILWLMQGLARDRVSCSLVCPPDGPMVTRYARVATRIATVGGRSVMSAPAIMKIAMLIKRWQIDVVHTCLYTSDVAGILAARIAGGRRVVCHIVGRNFYVTQERGLPRLCKQGLSRLHRLVYRLSDRLIAVSEAVKADLVQRPGVRVSPEKIRVIRHSLGHDGLAVSAGSFERVKRRLSLREHALVLSTIANLIPIKGHRYLLEAMAQVARSVPEAVCVLVGDGPQRQSLERMAHALGVDGCVVFAGTLEEELKRAVIRMSRAVVLPSLSEGLPVSLLEAMALGKPVVACDVGGVREAVVDQVTGLLVQPADSEALANAIHRLVSDHALADRMGQAGRCHFEETFSMHGMVSQVEALYAELLGG
jgi:glycosyltransferase involved in cell wall biosynthesis